MELSEATIHCQLFTLHCLSCKKQWRVNSGEWIVAELDSINIGSVGGGAELSVRLSIIYATS